MHCVYADTWMQSILTGILVLTLCDVLNTWANAQLPLSYFVAAVSVLPLSRLWYVLSYILSQTWFLRCEGINTILRQQQCYQVDYRVCLLNWSADLDKLQLCHQPFFGHKNVDLEITNWLKRTNETPIAHVFLCWHWSII